MSPIVVDQMNRPAKRKNVEVQRDYRARRQTHLQELELEGVLLRQKMARLDRENAASREENAVLKGQGGIDLEREVESVTTASRDEAGAAGLLCCLRTNAILPCVQEPGDIAQPQGHGSGMPATEPPGQAALAKSHIAVPALVPLVDIGEESPYLYSPSSRCKAVAAPNSPPSSPFARNALPSADLPTDEGTASNAILSEPVASCCNNLFACDDV